MKNHHHPMDCPSRRTELHRTSVSSSATKSRAHAINKRERERSPYHITTSPCCIPPSPLPVTPETTVLLCTTVLAGSPSGESGPASSMTLSSGGPPPVLTTDIFTVPVPAVIPESHERCVSTELFCEWNTGRRLCDEAEAAFIWDDESSGPGSG
jgi:hypothetical protein